MSSLNKVMLIGNLGADPEEKQFQNGNGVVNLRLATSESWKDKSSGERKERTEWHTVAIFSDGLRKVAMQYLKKGSKIYLEGKLQTRKWQDQSGNDRYSTEVVLNGFGDKLVMLGEKEQGGGGARQSGQRGEPQGGWNNRGNDGYAGGGGSNYDDLDDDIPF